MISEGRKYIDDYRIVDALHEGHSSLMVELKAGQVEWNGALDFDWRSEAEFQSHLFGVLEKWVDEESALQSWYNFSERSWLNFVVGSLPSGRDDWAGAEKLMREAILIADPDAWEYFLARAQLEQFQRRRREPLSSETQWDQYNSEMKDFEKAVDDAKTAKLECREKLAALYTKIADGTIGLKEKLPLQRKNPNYSVSESMLL